MSATHELTPTEIHMMSIMKDIGEAARALMRDNWRPIQGARTLCLADGTRAAATLEGAVLRVVWRPAGCKRDNVLAFGGVVTTLSMVTSTGVSYELTLNADGESVTAWTYGPGKIGFEPIREGDSEFTRLFDRLPRSASTYALAV